jgi:hypothetical protein
MTTNDLPQLPATASNADWDAYRAQLRGCANRGLISMNEFTQLIVSSHDAQSNLPQRPPRPSIATMIPQTGRLLPVSGSRLRECAVLIIRNPPAAAPNGLTASETLWYLRQAGFAVGGVRPVDVLRKALQQETVGVMKRPPTLCCQYRMYTYIPGSLSERTLYRWSQRFPTLASPLHQIAG